MRDWKKLAWLVGIFLVAYFIPLGNAKVQNAILEAFRLVTRGDPEVFHAVWVTLFCTTTSVTLAAIVAFPIGAWLGVHRRDGRGLLVFLMRVGMFTPTVVVGLLVYGLVSRQGILGSLGLCARLLGL